MISRYDERLVFGPSDSANIPYTRQLAAALYRPTIKERNRKRAVAKPKLSGNNQNSQRRCVVAGKERKRKVERGKRERRRTNKGRMPKWKPSVRESQVVTRNEA